MIGASRCPQPVTIQTPPATDPDPAHRPAGFTLGRLPADSAAAPTKPLTVWRQLSPPSAGRAGMRGCAPRALVGAGARMSQPDDDVLLELRFPATDLAATLGTAIPPRPRSGAGCPAAPVPRRRVRRWRAGPGPARHRPDRRPRTLVRGLGAGAG